MIITILLPVLFLTNPLTLMCSLGFASSFYSPLCFSQPSRTNDSGLLTHKETLPVRSVVLGDVHRPGSERAYRVGPLRCHGDSKSIPEPSMSPCKEMLFA